MHQDFEDHDEILADLEPTDFVADTRHPIILNGIKKCREVGLKPLIYSVSERLMATGDLTSQNQAHLGEYIGQLFITNPSMANIDFYAKKTKEYVFKRALYTASVKLHEALLKSQFNQSDAISAQMMILRSQIEEIWRPRSQFEGLYYASDLEGIDFPKSQFLMPDLIPEGVTLLAAEPKSGKSFFCLNLCLASAMGGKLLGLDIQKCDSLYISFEDTARDIQERLTPMLQGASFPKAIAIQHNWPPLGAGCETMIERHLDSHPDCRLVIIDTLAYVRTPSKGNLYLEETHLLKPIMALARHRPGLFIIIVHHVNKMPSNNVWERISGSYGLLGMVDAGLVLTRQGDITLIHSKGRRVPYRTGDDALAMQMDWNIYTWQNKGVAAVIELNDTQKGIFDAIQQGAETLKEIVEITGLTYNQAQKSVSKLVDTGKLKRVKTGKGKSFKIELVDEDY
jgi:hypothetical protein